MTITINDIPVSCTQSLTYMDAARLAGVEKGALAVMRKGQTLPLTAPAGDGENVHVVTYADEEGRRIYERSLRFVFLLAFSRLYPDSSVRFENSFGDGIYLSVRGMNLTQTQVEAIDAEMRAIVRAELPFSRHPMSRAEAIEYFSALGQSDKVRLLQYRPYEHFQMYECGGLQEYFYGEMAPTTGFVGLFALKFYAPGLILRLPTKAHPFEIGPFKDMPCLMRTFRESARWQEIIGCENAADLNALIDHKEIREFIRVNELHHDKQIFDIVDAFHQSGARLILIAGPSSSGKTTFTNRLYTTLRVSGLKPVKISLDDYYIDRDKIPLDENGERDLECVDALDVELFDEHMVRLLRGESVDMPLFDFNVGARAKKTHSLRVDADQPILIEGIHGLNDRLTARVPRAQKFKIYISALTNLNLDDHNRIRTTDARLLRRMVRDARFRGTDPEKTLQMWASVRRGEEKWIFPYQEEADVMFNSSLAYELAIMKKYVYPMLTAITPDCPHYTLARRLVKFLNYIHSSNAEDEIPHNSLLREFIGGSCFYREEE